MGSLYNQQPALFQDPHINYPIDNLTLSFSDYISRSQNIIRNTRLDLANNPLAELIIEANSPFELKPIHHDQKQRIGALLIHGLYDSPFMMRDIGQELQSQGMLVRSILLPGHGTIPGALLNVSYEDWLQAVEYGIASFQDEVDHLILVGYSTGGTLSLYHALENQHISGLVFISPAFKINSAFDFTTNWYHAVDWAWKRAEWMHVAPENDYIKYQSMAFNGAYQVYCLSKILREHEAAHQTKSPIWMSLCEADKTVSSEATLKYFAMNTNPKNQLIYYTNSTEKFPDSRIMTRTATYPDLKIIDFSHVAIPIAPNNPHYGAQGDYLYASHVYDNQEGYEYGEMNTAEDIFQSLLADLKIKNIHMQRLTFNPDFEFMMQSMRSFIKNVCEQIAQHQ